MFSRHISHRWASARITDYDRQHLATYIMLLDAHAANAPWPEALQYIFELSGRKSHTHLARAEWMTHTGYRLLLRES